MFEFSIPAGNFQIDRRYKAQITGVTRTVVIQENMVIIEPDSAHDTRRLWNVEYAKGCMSFLCSEGEEEFFKATGQTMFVNGRFVNVDDLSAQEFVHLQDKVVLITKAEWQEQTKTQQENGFGDIAIPLDLPIDEESKRWFLCDDQDWCSQYSNLSGWWLKTGKMDIVFSDQIERVVPVVWWIGRASLTPLEIALATVKHMLLKGPLGWVSRDEIWEAANLDGFSVGAALTLFRHRKVAEAALHTVVSR